MSTAAGHEVLRDSPGSAACLLGNLAIVRGALEAGVQFFSCYPGTPSSEVGDTFARLAAEQDILFEYSINEKIAVEIAFAASLTGARAMCAMKHLGLSYAGDPVSSLPYLGVDGGLVIVTAGDPSAITSPNEQDQRHYSRFLYYPVLDPATPDDALWMTRFAFELSEQTRVSGLVELGPLPDRRNEIRFTKNPARHVVTPDHARRMRTELTERYSRAESLLAGSRCYPRCGEGRQGIIASGVAHAYVTQALQDLGVADRVSLLQIGAYPIPEKILTDFLASVDSVLVAEELTPFVEQEVALAAFATGRNLPVLGKRSGHFPQEFEYNPDLVADALASYLHLDQPERKVCGVAADQAIADLPARPPVLCPGCPHRASFFVMRKVFGPRTVYANDIGCYTLGLGEPLHSCDIVLCMGASITQAAGIARTTGRRTVAYIGDSTFCHSGLPALMNAVQNNDQVTVCILNNYVTAMTGFQPSPASGPGGSGFSLEQIVRGLGVTDVYSLDPFAYETARQQLKQARDGTGVNVVIFNAPCRVNLRRRETEPHLPLAIDQELCDGCTLCVRLLGCPAIFISDDRYGIDEDLCDGCGLCVRVCSRDAICEVGER